MTFKRPHARFVLVGAMVLLAACSSSPKRADFPVGTDPSAKVLEVRSRMNEDEAQQYDQLSPQHFESASNALAQAQKRIDDRRSGDEVLEKAGEAVAELNAVEDNARKGSSSFAPVIHARKAALDAKAKQVLPEELASADKTFHSFGREIEKGDFHPKAQDISELEAKYSQIELKSVESGAVGESKAMIERAVRENAVEKAPQTLASAQVAYDSALRSIEADRRSPASYQPAVEASLKSARKLDQVMSTIGSSKTTEAAAVQIYEQKQQLLASQDRINQANSKALAAESQASAEKQTSAALQGENEKYANKAALNRKIESVKAEFSPNEAEVLRDGNKIILRLKNMKFSSGRYELTQSSIGTLQKVKEMIAAVPVAKVVVEGHTDAVGSEKRNVALSEKRAESVKNYLVAENSVPADKVEAQGLGYQRPLVTNKTAEGRAMNRRVDVIIESESQP